MKQDGHFHATVLVNNVEIEFLLILEQPIVLSTEDAKKLDYDYQINFGANLILLME